jgi:hypothetical protein
MNKTPRYWMHEVGDLPDAISAYLGGGRMSASEIQLFASYLQEWVNWEGWTPRGCKPDPELQNLREAAKNLTSREAIHRWLGRLLDFGIDPL